MAETKCHTLEDIDRIFNAKNPIAIARTHTGRVDEPVAKAVVFSEYRNEGVGESFSHAKGNVVPPC